LLASFIAPARRSRHLELFDKRRKDITRSLAHFKHLDERYLIRIAPREQKPSDILQSKGAPEICYAVSEDDQLDGKEIDLTHALATVIGRGMGTLLSCIPGKLAYFEDADCRWILERRS
jgi:hypothetical protein